MTIKYDGPQEILKLIDDWNEEMKHCMRDKVGIQNIKNDLGNKILAYAQQAELRGARLALEAAAEAADKWGRGEWVLKEVKRQRFTLHDLQVQTNIAGRGVAEDIRQLSPQDIIGKETN